MSSREKQNYGSTVRACYTGYITQAIVNNIAPLLFVTFGLVYDISLAGITALSSFNFAVQLTVDALSAKFIHKIGYRKGAVIAHICVVIGLIGMGVFPDLTEVLLGNGYYGLLMAICFYAVGGGLIEVMISPLTDGCASENKGMAMNFLHSFYCWGQVAVIALSTLFFKVVGIENWRVLVCLLAIIPFVNAIAFSKVPIPEIEADIHPVPMKKLFMNRVFLLLVVLMICSGASELAMSQWSSAFAEKGLKVSKAFGDLLGPCLFAILMGTARVVAALLEGKIKTETMMIGSGVLCFISYLTAALSPNAVISLLGCAVCGFSVGVFWPGTFNMASEKCPEGGTKMFALLALSGDIGCFTGPAVVGSISGFFNGNLRAGILASGLFPVILVVFVIIMSYYGKKTKNR